MLKKTLFFLFITITSSMLFAQGSKGAEGNKWDVNSPFNKTKTVNFTVSEGTWMNLDVSPDGKSIAFDMLGDIYTLPIEGGEAKCIAKGAAYEIQPRFSPDGKKILFTSDRGGGDNIWYMNLDGSDKKQITKEDFRLLNNGVWAADGQYIIARKHFTAGRSLGAGEMWMYHLTGGAGLQLTKKRNDQMDTGEPCTSKDGKYMYYSDDSSPGNSFEYNKDPNGQIYVIRRYNMATGEIETVTGGSGGACRPQISPDGKTLAFIKRVRFQSVLYLHDLSTGEEKPLFKDLTRDQQETWAIFGVYPNFNWTPDGKHIVIYAKGKIYKIAVETGNAQNIPFTAKVEQTITEAVNFKQEPFTPTFEAKMIRHATTSPDGKLLAFNAAGHIYIKNLPDGKPKRLTIDSEFEFEPSFSSDSRYIVYTTWSDAEKGSIRLIDLWEKTEFYNAKTLTQEKGFYHSPSFGNSDQTIVYRKGGGTNFSGFTHTKNTGIYTMDIKGSNVTFIQKDGESPILSADGKRLYYLNDPGMNKTYHCRNLLTGEVRTLFTSKYGTQFSISPDEKWIAFTDLFQCYIVPYPQIGKEIDLSGGTNTIPIKKVTTSAGTCLHWDGNSQALHWVLGPRYYTQELKKTFAFVANESNLSVDTVGINIGLTLTSDAPNGQIAFTNARIITMEGEEVIEKGYILIDQNKIKEIGKGEKTFGAEVKVIDATGKTIIPGLVDVHAHLGANYNGISPQQQWGYFANLAFGVTTTHDPSNSTEMVFSQHEMVEAGIMTGPRIFSTGTILYGADGDFKAVINSYEDAKNNLRRLKAVGAFSVKSYNQPRREQRQQILKAANDLKMNVYPEGGSTFVHNMTQVIDGHTGIEHSIPVSTLYDDVVQLWKNTKVGYTPTLIVGYGGIWGENYWYDKTNVWENKKLLTFTPRAIIDQRSRRRVKSPDEEYGHFENTASCTKLSNAGVKVNLGAHGQLQGLGVHWELWMLEQGGMGKHQALRCATINGADYIGMGHALGSLKTGKLADLVVLSANPLDNIQNTEKIDYVMKNGRLYDPNTMNEVGNNAKERLPFYWENSNYSENFDWHEDTHSFEHGKCGCHAH